MTYKYKIRMKMENPEYGSFARDEIVPQGYSVGCDGFMYVSILWPEEGNVGMSVNFGGMDGRTQKPLSDTERFKIWTFLAKELSESQELGEGRKQLCKAAFEEFVQAVLRAQERSGMH